MTSDPFAVLGLPVDASRGDVRAARRSLAKDLHPDKGGDGAKMQRVNAAAAEALRRIATPEPAAGADDTPVPADRAPTPPRPTTQPDLAGIGYDVPSFTVEALPVDTFHALLAAGSAMGVVVDEDPPYRLDVEMDGPPRCWCRLEIAPDAGASTVSLAASTERGHRLRIEAVRDVWVRALNQLEWSQIADDG